MRWQSGRVTAWSLLSSLWQHSFTSHVKTGVLYLLTVITYAKFTEDMSNTVCTKAFPSYLINKIWKCAWMLILMIYVGMGQSMHHIQAYPSWMQMPFSMKEGNLPKRSFLYNNLGYGNSIAIALVVYQKPDQICYIVDFLDINNWNHTYTS